MHKQIPEANEIEISLLGGGGGTGECIVAHVGNNEWIVIDSFLSKKSRQPASLEYLSRMGISATAIKLVVASHWHNDHVKGISNLILEATEAKFAISSALKSDEFGALLEIDQNTHTRQKSISELRSALQVIRERGTPVTTASQDKDIWCSNDEVCRIQALSPSDLAEELARKEIAQIVKGFNTANRKVLDINPNHNSVVVRIKAGDKDILLGSDLEETGEAGIGWSAILTAINRPRQSASTFKVAHHGSETSYTPKVWKKLLVPNPVALITPFKGGQTKLPTLEYSNRILAHTPHAYITSDPNIKFKPKKRDNKVEKTIKQLGYSPVELSYPDGHIRLRSKSDEEGWRIELFGSAVALKDCQWS